MVPTQALLAALAALAAPSPTPPPADLPPPSTQGEGMRFAHPVMTNTQQSPAMMPAHHAEQPKRSGGGGGGSSGNAGNRSSESTATTGSTTATPTGTISAQGQTPTTEGQVMTATDPSNPFVLAPPSGPAVDPADVATAFTLTMTTRTAAGGGSNGTAAVMPDALPATDSPVQTPEPGTIFLFLAGAGVGGGAVMRKWVRRKR